jgi:hypothetical protein
MLVQRFIWVNLFCDKAHQQLSNMADDPTALSAKIAATDKELEAVKGKISVIEGGGDDLAKEHGYSTRITALESLRVEKVELDKRLTTYEIRLTALTQQQQQSGAGTSMLPVRQEFVVFRCQSSCCMHQQILQLWKCVLFFHALSAAACCC